MAISWSSQQKVIFEWFRDGKGNLVVRARAGTGKSTTIVEAQNYAPEDDILMAAFNARIAKELTAKVRNANGRAEVKTLHGVGYGIISRYWDRVYLDKKRGFVLAKAVVGEQGPDEMIGRVKKLAGLAKGMLVRFDPADESILKEVIGIAVRFGVEPDHLWQRDGWTTERIAKLAIKAMDMARSRQDGRSAIDFDDMLFLPLANNWAQPRYSLVMIDEAQDMTPAQLELARRVVTSDGRIAVIGDDRQAIYAFRGADSDALDRLKRELNATELGLTATYRCGKSIVAYAKRIVADFEAGEKNHEGEIVSVSEAKLGEMAQVGDFILSRKNAPLVPLCLRFLRAGKRARIEGKEVADGLIAIAKRWKSKSMAQLQDSIAKWRDREIDRLMKQDTDESLERADVVEDQAAILLALCDGIKKPEELAKKLEELFGDSEDDPRPSIVLSSIHKAKGLEARRVFVLRDTLYPKRFKILPDGRLVEDTDPKKHREEANLEYVAVTRAIETLVWVSAA